MEQLVLNWDGPFKLDQRIPVHLVGAIGLYLCECDSKIVYVGKAETQGAFKRLKDHFRGIMDSTGKCVLKHTRTKNKSEINIWVGWIEEGESRELINDAEKLVIYKLNARGRVPCNRTYSDKYRGRSLHLRNRGKYPKDLPEELQYI